MGLRQPIRADKRRPVEVAGQAARESPRVLERVSKPDFGEGRLAPERSDAPATERPGASLRSSPATRPEVLKWAVDTLPALNLTASRVLVGQDREQALQAALASLPEDDRVAIRLHYVDCRSVADPAKALGRTEAAVRALLDRANKRLRGELGRLSQYIIVR